MITKTKSKISSVQSGEKPKRNYLLVEFSVLSLVAFIIIGYVVVSAVRPAIENFTITEKENSSVVFVNRYANDVLTKNDFNLPLTPEQQDRMTTFVDNLPIKGSLRTYILDPSGTIIYAKPQEFIGGSLSDNTDVQFAIEKRRATARLEGLTPEDQVALGVTEALVEVIPLTFGASFEVQGIVYTISRAGLLRSQIEDTEREMIVRIIGGLLFLYAVLFVIVWRASRTIRQQSSELRLYARTLEQRVKDRTRSLEESTKRQLKQAEELAKLKDEFLYIATHELKSPVTNLRWALDAFFSSRKLQKEASPFLRETMQGIRRVSERLTSLVTDLLNIARLESGAVQVSVHPTDLLSVVQDMVLQFKTAAEKQGVHLTLTYDSAKKFPFVLSDSERLKEVFSNLISNAIKFSSKGGSIEIVVVPDGNFLEARVADTGMGMTPEELSHLFSKFWRGHKEIEGTGLGMWITKQLIVRMGGELQVESKKGEGTTFIVRLPIAKERGMREKGSKEQEGLTL